MSLLSEAMENCTLMNKTTANDGYGGYVESWVEGATFEAAIYMQNSIQTSIAEEDGVKGLYQITTSREIRLGFHDVFRRESDGQYFRVTSKDENKTPASASLDMRVVMAEEFIPTEAVNG
jgi:hypothetical protein